MFILLVEDDPSTAESLELMLRKADHNTYVTDLGEEGIELAKLYDYDLIILDLTLPDMDGYEVLRRLRQAKLDTPVLILTGREGIEHKVRGFGLGADDYVTKPFQREELMARVRAVVRRSHVHDPSVLLIGELTLDLDKKLVEAAGLPIHLTGKEYQMLELMALRKGSTITKEMFLDHLYGGMDEPEVKIIDVFICNLRKKLALATGGQHCIRTIWGRGYMLRDPESEETVSTDMPQPNAGNHQEHRTTEKLGTAGAPAVWGWGESRGFFGQPRELIAKTPWGFALPGAPTGLRGAAVNAPCSVLFRPPRY